MKKTNSVQGLHAKVRFLKAKKYFNIPVDHVRCLTKKIINEKLYKGKLFAAKSPLDKKYHAVEVVNIDSLDALEELNLKRYPVTKFNKSAIDSVDCSETLVYNSKEKQKNDVIKKKEIQRKIILSQRESQNKIIQQKMATLQKSQTLDVGKSDIDNTNETQTIQNLQRELAQLKETMERKERIHDTYIKVFQREKQNLEKKLASANARINVLQNLYEVNNDWAESEPDNHGFDIYTSTPKSSKTHWKAYNQEKTALPSTSGYSPFNRKTKTQQISNQKESSYSEYVESSPLRYLKETNDKIRRDLVDLKVKDISFSSDTEMAETNNDERNHCTGVSSKKITSRSSEPEKPTSSQNKGKKRNFDEMYDQLPRIIPKKTCVNTPKGSKVKRMTLNHDLSVDREAWDMWESDPNLTSRQYIIKLARSFWSVDELLDRSVSGNERLRRAPGHNQERKILTPQKVETIHSCVKSWGARRGLTGFALKNAVKSVNRVLTSLINYEISQERKRQKSENQLTED